MGSKKSTTTTTHDVPDYIEEGSQQAVNLGRRIADRRYEAFQGERFAPLHENEQQAVNLASHGTGAGKYIDRAAEQLTGIKTFPDSDITAYQNPYTDAVEGNVMRNLNSAAGRASRSTAYKSAAGSSGDVLAQGSLNRNLLRSVGETSSQIRGQAFGQAMNAWRGDQDMKVRAAQAWNETAGDVTRMNSQQIQDLMKTGQTARVVQQLDKDFDYQQWQEARDWDVTNLGPLLESLNVPYESTDKTVTKKKGGVWGQIIGAGALVAGAIFAPVTGGASLAAGSAVAKAAN